jgi:hypothetical protein
MTDQTTLEQKRAEAKAYKGVTYDDRIKKFTASIMINGERRYLGAFTTAGEASVIYEQTRAENKIHRVPRGLSGMSVKRALAEFEDTADRDAKKHIVAGQILTVPDGQRFRVEGMQRRNKSNEYVWSSRCRVCPAHFEQNTGLKLRNLNGMTRTCPEHRGQLGKMEMLAWRDPVEWDEPPKKIAPVVLPQRHARAGAEPIPDNWKPALKAYAEKQRKIHPGISLEDIREKYTALLFEMSDGPSARDEAIEDLAAEPPKDNEDLI